MIEVQDLVYEYPNRRALSGVSLTIQPGTVTALVGPNGAGKTTLLRCLAALERPFSGRVRIDGVDTAEQPRDVHRRLGFLPDFFGLYDELSVARCLGYAAMARGLDRSAVGAAVDKAAARVGLTDRLGQMAGELSRGLRQRLAIGQAIVHEPRVLLLDEPAAGLDPDARRSLSHLLLALRDEGMTLVVSSHILAELEDYCEEMVVVDGGRIAGGGPIRTSASERVRLRLALAVARPDFADILRRRDDLAVETAGDDWAVVALGPDPALRARLLADLVGAGLPVIEATPLKRRLEDAYFEQVGGTGARPSMDRTQMGGRA